MIKANLDREDKEGGQGSGSSGSNNSRSPDIITRFYKFIVKEEGLMFD